MENAQQRLVVAQFGPRAKAYVESAVHAQGADLDDLCTLLRRARPGACWTSAAAPAMSAFVSHLRCNM